VTRRIPLEHRDRCLRVHLCGVRGHAARESVPRGGIPAPFLGQVAPPRLATKRWTANGRRSMVARSS